jgi:hypothetical protein
MSVIAPQWAFAAQAVDGAGDPHLAPGVHLRLLFSEKLGLPVAPFQVYRLDLGLRAGRLATRSDGIRWTDSRGAALTPPFNVTPDNPVTGWIATDMPAVCCWIEVLCVGHRGTGPGPIPGVPIRIPTLPIRTSGSRYPHRRRGAVRAAARGGVAARSAASGAASTCRPTPP